MSTSDRLLLILHIGFAIFTLGPLTAATMATPRYIRRRDPRVLRYLNRATRIYGLGALGIFLFGLFLAGGRFDEVWLSASMTLFIVALVLLVIVERDQRKAIHRVEVAVAEDRTVAAEEAARPHHEGAEQGTAAEAGNVAQVERGRIAAISGVVALLWLVILVLMVWNG
ncbi:hypothetical protein [Thermomonospora cellulosilytica]|uniref:Heme exporter protein D n=1 Tax=Thermomonospora cellulosilytica TaxID=1411118 RepID=A0A7W3MXA4_9ACTN|nr:hypothetical protein [Thermomonospora cellulosilytica]MBA9003605.1 heme exporter protein D [Thermomonospora cellulosilytica]